MTENGVDIGEKCDNCLLIIKRMDAPQIHGKWVLCPECYERLKKDNELTEIKTASLPQPVRRRTKPVILRAAMRGIDAVAKSMVASPASLPRGAIICPNPNCGYRGKPRRRARGSLFLLVFLFCLFIIPGLLYLMFRSGYVLICPRCGLQIREDLT